LTTKEHSSDGKVSFAADVNSFAKATSAIEASVGNSDSASDTRFLLFFNRADGAASQWGTYTQIPSASTLATEIGSSSMMIDSPDQLIVQGGKDYLFTQYLNGVPNSLCNQASWTVSGTGDSASTYDVSMGDVSRPAIAKTDETQANRCEFSVKMTPKPSFFTTQSAKLSYQISFKGDANLPKLQFASVLPPFSSGLSPDLHLAKDLRSWHDSVPDPANPSIHSLTWTVQLSVDDSADKIDVSSVKADDLILSCSDNTKREIVAPTVSVLGGGTKILTVTFSHTVDTDSDNEDLTDPKQHLTCSLANDLIFTMLTPGPGSTTRKISRPVPAAVVLYYPQMKAVGATVIVPPAQPASQAATPAKPLVNVTKP
jgi:hypothetical protein